MYCFYGAFRFTFLRHDTHLANSSILRAKWTSYLTMNPSVFDSCPNFLSITPSLLTQLVETSDFFMCQNWPVFLPGSMCLSMWLTSINRLVLEKQSEWRGFDGSNWEERQQSLYTELKGLIVCEMCCFHWEIWVINKQKMTGCVINMSAEAFWRSSEGWSHKIPL